MQTWMKDARRTLGVACITVTTVLICTTILTSCRQDTPAPGKTDSTKAKSESQGGAYSSGKGDSPRATTPLLKGWEKPQAVLVFSGDEHGYLEPCGCSERQAGGFARRADFIRQLKEDRGWSVSAFDVGGILNEKRVTYPQSKIKFHHMLLGFQKMGYQGLEIGLEELMLGPDALYVEHQAVSTEDGFDVPFLGANVTFYGTKELGTPVNSRVVQVGETKVGVIGIVGTSTLKKIQQTGLTADESLLKIDVPAEAIRKELEALKAENPDLLVLLSHSDIDESEALAKEFPEFKIVVTANSAEDPRKKPNYVGETMIVHVGKKGKNVVAVGLFAENQLKHELVELDMDRFAIDPGMVELMQEYQDVLKEQYDSMVNDDLAIGHPSGKTFAGADSCKECHTYAYNIWSQSKHAHALDSLTKGRPGQEATWVNRIWDPECLACHTTGWEPQEILQYKSGFASLEKTPHLAGNQCENCHGPAAEHVALEQAWKKTGMLTPETIESRKSLQLLKAEAEQKVCTHCHDHENSPKFDFEKYWKEVNHSGRKD